VTTGGSTERPFDRDGTRWLRCPACGQETQITDAQLAVIDRHNDMRPGLTYTKIARAELVALGSVQSATFKKVTIAGMESYDVKFENGVAVCPMVPTADGEVATGSFHCQAGWTHDLLVKREAANAPRPGSEAALRRQIEAIRNGAPMYGEMTEALASSFPRRVSKLQRLLAYWGPCSPCPSSGKGITTMFSSLAALQTGAST